MERKLCLSCKVEKNTSEFYFRSYKKDGPKVPFGECKVCLNKRATKNRKQRREENPDDFYEKERKYASAHYSENREVYRDGALKQRYGIGLQEWMKLYEANLGCCYICGDYYPPERGTQKNRSLCVDHCHDTGKIRGLLCRKCNTGIGGLRDNIELIDKAKQYLLSFRDEEAGSSTGFGG